LATPKKTDPNIERKGLSMSKRKLILLPLLSVLLAANANGEDTERDAILALMDQAFDAVASRDPDDMRAIQLAEGTSLSFRPHPNGKHGEQEMRMASNEELVASDISDGRKFLERWTNEPTVTIRDRIAVVWGEYEFLIDGEFSHCGVDAVDLAKVDGDWKIVNWMWTVERDNCPTGN
jgi:hypothetical protein